MGSLAGLDLDAGEVNVQPGRVRGPKICCAGLTDAAWWPGNCGVMLFPSVAMTYLFLNTGEPPVPHFSCPGRLLNWDWNVAIVNFC